MTTATLLLRYSLLSLVLVIPASWAQDEPNAPDVSMRELIESEQEVEKVVEEIKDSQSRGERVKSTPLKTLVALRTAGRSREYAKAADFLDMRYLPDEMSEATPEELIRALAYVFARQNIIQLADISDEHEGRQNDGLPSYRDQIGEVVLSDETVPIYLQSIPDGKGSRVWKISNATVAKIPKMWDELGFSPIALYLNNTLPQGSFMGMDNWQIMAIIIFIVVAWPLATLICALLLRLVLRLWDHFPIATTNFIRSPLRFFVFIVIVRELINQLGLSLTSLVWLQSSGVGYVAYTVLAMGALSFIRDYQIRKMQRAGNTHYVALLKPFSTIVKAIVVTIIGLFWAESAGYNMSTVLAGLGVGSLAVALAAQKTLENVIGAITLYAARPVKAGDFCKFGDIVGTVEEIGLRSTIIRTPDRTQVVIPNAVFSSTGVENYSVRDRIRFYRRLRLQMGSSEQLRFALGQIRGMLYAHPKVLQETVSARFETIEDATAWLRLDANVETTDYQEFLAVAEDLNLRIVDIVEQSGLHFAGPGRLLYSSELPASGASGEEVKQTLQQWREQDRLPFPNYSEAQRADLQGSLQYPPKGSAS